MTLCKAAIRRRLQLKHGIVISTSHNYHQGASLSPWSYTTTCVLTFYLGLTLEEETSPS